MKNANESLSRKPKEKRPLGKPEYKWRGYQ
jgi:hypothetical protein